ncbi:hypothetical protein [Dysosmobacter sp.]|uniref:hypothetical protein n=1 Tax=Dysosmobacter sp. TaxID=2591382 RepID=UPI003AB7370C
MRRGLWALAALLLLTAACAAPAEQGPEEARTVSEEAAESPAGQDRAIAPYEEIVTSFVGAYPAEFGDAYLEDNYLWVCLTDGSEQMQEKYLALSGDPEILRFRKVDYGCNDLRDLQDAIVDTPEIVFASVGVNVAENRVDVGIPDLEQEEQTMERIRVHLPPELAERFPEELPVEISQEDFATVS